MEASEAQLKAQQPSDKRSLQRFGELYRPALARALSLPSSFDLGAEFTGEEIPGLLFKPDGRVRLQPSRVALVVSDNPEKRPGALEKRLLDLGWTVLAIDCFGIGEHKAPEGAPERDLDAGFFDTYNRTDTAERVHDVLAAVDYLGSLGKVSVVGQGMAGLWCLLAAPFARGVEAVVVDACGLDLASDQALLDELYMPCLRRAGDLRSAMSLSTGARLLIHNTQGKFGTSWAESAFGAAGRRDALMLREAEARAVKIAAWVCEG